MARVVQRFTEKPRECSYLADRQATLDYRVMTDVSPEELEQLLIRGWRRFGPVYFRPSCAGCMECVSIRIPVATFQPSDSQKRALRRNKRFRVEVRRPTVDAERLELYGRWHSQREELRQWTASPLDEQDYQQQFAFPHPAAVEIASYDGDRLVSVGLCDVTKSCWSAVYFFFDPEVGRLSPGIANVMRSVELARDYGIPHVYLGYRVLGCASMRYKATFHPHELLEGRPSFEEPPVWRVNPDASGTPPEPPPTPP
jgi:arginyl-tRNA--protein-N-Asp/Glu arginylyltransferase